MSSQPEKAGYPLSDKPARLRRALRERLSRAGRDAPSLIAPGIYDAYGARMVQHAGFEAVYMTGNGVSASLLGRPDVGLVDLSMISAHARRIAACVDLPLICDADTGYGGAAAVRRTVEEFEAAGVAAIHIEDQQSPKRCAQFAGARAVLPFETAVARIAAAVAARDSAGLLVIARTDCAASLGLDEAIRRARAFAQAGVDAVFVELKAGERVLDEIRRVTQAVEAPCIFNLDTGGPLAGLGSTELQSLGIALAIYPSLIRTSLGFTMREALKHLREDGNTGAMRGRMLSAAEYNAYLGLAEVEEWEQRFPA
ncbi:isocitrate lyase/PEP mutase family protein [Candidimonas humi]|uniref:Oxaloacetate decarboxylase n=1 Tax=Candidimonas humi TaxID=683355 RepID=A0ABV8NXK4_9BURK|nr:isocitrate lyase/PEP mutase family protein [Candidimonas humi]MBV6304549.1 isocitrate lyase/PEP mutase family protein [Candidimonas humi]